MRACVRGLTGFCGQGSVVFAAPYHEQRQRGGSGTSLDDLQQASRFPWSADVGSGCLPRRLHFP